MKTILMVDDGKLNLDAARNALKDTYEVISVPWGDQVRACVERGECDIILLGVQMPDVNGFEVLEQIQMMESCADTPVIFLIADGDSETEVLCFEKGAADCIARPFAPAVMRSRIDRALELKELRRSLAERIREKDRVVSDMWNKSHQDSLTGLWNRMYTENTVDELLARGAKGALMMIDIDNFKQVNDTCGHIAGDQTLKILADILRDVFSPEDILCRLGGDEFAVFAKDIVSKEMLGGRATEIISRLSRKMQEHDFEISATISVGIARVPDDGVEFSQLYSCADKALYYVKRNGKNAYHFFGDRMQEGAGRGGKTVDLRYLQDLMNREDKGTGAYLMDFESFHHVYNFIHRFIDRNERDVQTVLFTVSESGGAELDTAEAEHALELLEKAIYTSLRRSDVSTRYSSRQLVVILMDTDTENGDRVAERILANFHKEYTSDKARIDYGIARMITRG